MIRTKWIKGFEESKRCLEISLAITRSNLDLIEKQHLGEGQDPTMPNFRPDSMNAWQEIRAITEELKRVNLQLANCRK